MGLDAAQAPHERDLVLRWRKSERARLIAARLGISAESRTRRSTQIFSRLDALLPKLDGKIVSLYWPLQGEPDPRHWLEAILLRGAICALPVVVTKGAPLSFRSWRPGERLVRGIWNIPVPEAGLDEVPDVVLAPVVGFDQGRFRLGYGGGYFDRTLAALAAKPRVIGLGYACAAIPTIHPLPHDIPMDTIVTDEAVL